MALIDGTYEVVDKNAKKPSHKWANCIENRAFTSFIGIYEMASTQLVVDVRSLEIGSEALLVIDSPISICSAEFRKN